MGVELLAGAAEGANVRAEHTQFGFAYGAAEVNRLCSDEKKGWCLIDFRTPRQTLQIYVTKTGKIRVYDQHGNEWKPHA